MSTQPDRTRELIHQVNNLLGVVYTQAAVARAKGSTEAALEALALIEKSAQETGEVVQRCRAALRAASDQSATGSGETG